LTINSVECNIVFAVAETTNSDNHINRILKQCKLFVDFLLIDVIEFDCREMTFDP